MNSKSHHKAATLMVQGTTSDAGKSILVAGLARVYTRLKYRVAPFKPQNMALNSAVTIDGGEIGRAQAVQAQACGLEAQIDFNPILLKPSSDTGAQVIIHGHAIENMEAQHYHDYKQVAMTAVLESHQRLEQNYQLVMVEGAGSPAEINLRDNDIANMGFAEKVDCPVIIVADIDRGGVFAHLVGTLALLSESEQQRVIGFVINRFRGDIALLNSGLTWLEEYTGKPVLGVLPYLMDFYLDAEDAIAHQGSVEAHHLTVVVPVLPRISNHTDFDPLRLHPNVNLIYVPAGQPLPAADLIILPGSKNVRNDLNFFNKQGWNKALEKHLRYGGKVLGICGGYQMLGKSIHDPLGIEGEAGSSSGLGLLNVETTLAPKKQLRRVKGEMTLLDKPVTVTGYEIHQGVTQVAPEHQALLTLKELGAQACSNYVDGAINTDGQVVGCYLHGLFDQSEAVQAILQWAGLAEPKHFDINQLREQQIDRLADTIEEHMDINKLTHLAKIPQHN